MYFIPVVVFKRTAFIWNIYFYIVNIFTINFFKNVIILTPKYLNGLLSESHLINVKFVNSFFFCLNSILNSFIYFLFEINILLHYKHLYY